MEVLDKLKIFYKRLYEASVPCAVLMVQGNVLALTPKHILIALQLLCSSLFCN